jgi:hypothetical protein
MDPEPIIPSEPQALPSLLTVGSTSWKPACKPYGLEAEPELTISSLQTPHWDEIPDLYQDKDDSENRNQN